MPPEEEAAVVKAILEKPLNELTEDDIAQLTREDCRCYLKKKGMRRPSWNKCQAIQQVIMLKAILETSPDSAAGSCRRRSPDDDPTSNSGGTYAVVENSASGDRKTTNLVKDLDKPQESAKTRPADSPISPPGQMTIFYCGKVNVYDDVPVSQAQAILHIAASPLELFPEGQLIDSAKIGQQRLPCASKAVCTKPVQESVAVVLPILQTGKVSARGEEKSMLHDGNSVEVPSTRKASLQRYLEKKKDRFKSKRKAEVAPCASLDMYFNYKLLSRNTFTFSPPLIRLSSTPARCSSVDNDSLKNVCLSTGLGNQGL